MESKLKIGKNRRGERKYDYWLGLTTSSEMSK